MFGCPEPSKKVWLSNFFRRLLNHFVFRTFFCSVKVKVLWESYKCFEKKEQIHSDKKFDLVRLEVNLRGFGFCSTIASLHTDVKMKHLCKMLHLWACKISHTLSSWPFSFWFWSAIIDVFEPLITTTLVSELASVKCHYNNTITTPFDWRKIKSLQALSWLPHRDHIHGWYPFSRPDQNRNEE